MTPADVGRYQLYSRQGALGSIASIDLDRVRVQQAVSRATTAAQALLELQQEWTELEGTAERLLAKGEAFQRLTLEMERGAKRDLALDAGRSGQPVAPATGAGLGSQRRAPAESSAGFRVASPRGRGGYDARRGSYSQQRHWVPRSGWMRVSALVLTGGLLAIGVIYAAQKLRPAEQAVVAGAPPVIAPAQQQGEQEQKPPENDVAAERAALDALPNQ
jgi:hypothetical protein